MNRRAFISLLGGAAAAWPVAGRAQERERMRRIGVLMFSTEDEVESKVWVSSFVLGLKELNWIEGSNVHLDYRWTAGDPERARIFAGELVALKPDVILASNTTTLVALHQVTRTTPIVFANVSDPVGGGFVQSFARPGGNITGFVPAEPSLGGKWLTLLKEIAPGIKRVAFIFNPMTAPYAGEFAGSAANAAAPSATEFIETPVNDDADIERGLASLAREPNGGLIVLPSAFTVTRRKFIIALAARHLLPAIYAYRYFVIDGGLMSYGNNMPDQFHQAATYVHRILNGAKPSDLPIQAPTKFECLINLSTAKTLGLTFPPHVLAIADEVIE